MIRHIEYGEHWSPIYQDWRYPYSEEEARRKHEARELYTALITLHDDTHLALELCFAFSYCNIYFFDALGRGILTYVFEPTDDGRLFLCEIATGEYEGDSRFPVRGFSWTYKQDGRKKTLLCETRRITLLEENEPVDVSTHFEPLPPFGEWESLIRRDRSRPVPLPN